jgi:hypothetical protein
MINSVALLTMWLKRTLNPIELKLPAKPVMPGLVPGIHALPLNNQERRGWPGPAMTKRVMADRVEKAGKC